MKQIKYVMMLAALSFGLVAGSAMAAKPMTLYQQQKFCTHYAGFYAGMAQMEEAGLPYDVTARMYLFYMRATNEKFISLVVKAIGHYRNTGHWKGLPVIVAQAKDTERQIEAFKAAKPGVNYYSGAYQRCIAQYPVTSK